MSIIALTDRGIQKALKELKDSKGSRVDYYEETTAGLSIRVSPKGTVTWFLKYFTLKGQQRRLKLGRYPDLRLGAARAEAIKVKGRVASGADPAVEKKQARETQRDALTFGELCDTYMEQHAKPKKRSWKKDDRILSTYFGDWRKRTAGDITDLDIDKRLRELVEDNGPAMADRSFACLRMVFTFALKSPALRRRAGRPAHNPCRDVARPAAPVSRDRIYKDEELAKLWPAFEKISGPGAVFKVCLLSGQRLNEVAGMKWSEIEGNLWTVPAERSKNKKPHVVPLSALALEIIEPRRALGSDYVFPSPVSNTKPIGAFNKPAAEVQEISGIADFRSHDLRRSCASGITRLGFSRFIADQVLAHTIPGVGGTYDRHDYLREKGEALAAWERHLRTVFGLGGNVVALSRTPAA